MILFQMMKSFMQEIFCSGISNKRAHIQKFLDDPYVRKHFPDCKHSDYSFLLSHRDTTCIYNPIEVQ